MALEQQSGSGLGILSCLGVTPLLWHSLGLLLPAKPGLEADGHLKIAGESLRCHFSSCSVEQKLVEGGEGMASPGALRQRLLLSVSTQWIRG